MKRQRAIQQLGYETELAGSWKVVAYPRGKPPRELAVFRGMPTQVTSFSFADPFGARSMEVTFPMVTMFDARGRGDLDWAVKHTDVDIIWDGAVPEGYSSHMLSPGMRWEGYITRFSFSSAGMSVQMKGAGLQLDRYLAKPEYTSRPMPYEWAIARQFINKPALRLMPLRIQWPDWWTKTYVAQNGRPSYLIPAGVTDGDFWTGLTTRSTGTWDPALTSYIQGLLSAMYSERGRWTMDLEPGRQPVLFHRDFVNGPGPDVATVNPRDPGVKIEFSEDWEQSLTTVYAQGQSLSGVAYTGMQVSNDGAETSYRPMAALRQVYPVIGENGWYDPEIMPSEVLLQTQAGLSADDAAIVSRAHLSRFAEPGSTGTVVLKSDPTFNGQVLPRHLLRAGMAVHLPYIGGRKEGMIARISESTASLVGDREVTLTIDTKQRDQLTVEEVRTRGRDALQVSRMLVAGQYQPPVPDQLYPWSYAEGSGYIPSNSAYNAQPLFEGMPSETMFPWEDWTTQRPPRSSKWRNCYVGLSEASSNADKNWVVQQNAWGSNMGIPIRMAQAGQIRLLQVAAYDADGHVLRVPFHISFYYIGSVNVASMPMIPVEQVSMFPPYEAGQHSPFVRDAFESFKADGTRPNPKIPNPIESVGLVKPFGTFYEKAGFWPGSYAEGDSATGLLVDESTWAFDISGVGDAVFDPYSLESNLTNVRSGYLYAMIYCDENVDQEVYFMGRMFRVEPGSGV